jgi:transposase-like protein
MRKDDDELIDSWLKKRLGVFSCPVCKKKLAPSTAHSMLRVFHGRYGTRIVAPHGTGTCPTCGATLQLKFGTTLGKIATSLGFLIAIISVVAAVIYAQLTYGNAPIRDPSTILLLLAIGLVSMIAGAAIYRIEGVRHEQVVVVSS